MEVSCGKVFKFEAEQIIPDHPNCGRTHGHSYKVEVEIGWQRNSEDWVMDFAELSKMMKPIIDKYFDHCPLLVKCAKCGFVESTFTEFVEKEARFIPHKEYIVPTAENIAKYLFYYLDRELRKKGKTLLRVRVWETDTSWAEAKYSPPLIEY